MGSGIDDVRDALDMPVRHRRVRPPGSGPLSPHVSFGREIDPFRGRWLGTTASPGTRPVNLKPTSARTAVAAREDRRRRRRTRAAPSDRAARALPTRRPRDSGTRHPTGVSSTLPLRGLYDLQHHGTYGRPRTDYTPYVDPGYPPPATGRFRRRRAADRARLVAIAIIASVPCWWRAWQRGAARPRLRNRTPPRPRFERPARAAAYRIHRPPVLAAKLDPSIVDITGVKEDADGQTVEDDAGTGVIISRNGQALTHGHVIEDDDQGLQATPARRHTYPSRSSARPHDDVALVQIQGLTDALDRTRRAASPLDERGGGGLRRRARAGR